MRAVFGVISLVIVLAIVGLVTTRQMKASRLVSSGSLQQGVVMPAASGTPREQAQQIQRQVADDVARALADGAARQASAAE